MYALCDLLYWHKPFRFNSRRILLYSLGECDKAYMSIMICFFFKICDWVHPDLGQLGLVCKSPFVMGLFVFEHHLFSMWRLIACPRYCHVGHLFGLSYWQGYLQLLSIEFD